MKYGFIFEHRKEFAIRAMCRVLEVSASGYYGWRGRPQSRRAQDNDQLMDKIRAIHSQSRNNYGSPKVYRRLRQSGEECNHKRVERLMRENGIGAKRVKKFKVRTDSRHGEPVADNFLGRAFKVSEPDKVWVSDITYIRLSQEFIYLAVILDSWSRRCVGWALEPYLEAELALEALRMALVTRNIQPGLVHHSDRGVQYASSDYTGLLNHHGVRISMSRRGNCYDNAKAESFIKTLKYEEVYLSNYESIAEARASVGNFIEEVYNRKRLHSALGYVPLAEFEQLKVQPASP